MTLEEYERTLIPTDEEHKKTRQMIDNLREELASKGIVRRIKAVARD
jgi:hypothetical protein